ncbi:MAG: hypothetical protein GMKNLPBB_03041 [Myxococcota bacterium]|nr:hypothetical protein [Myxococcota bacterium]
MSNAASRSGVRRLREIADRLRAKVSGGRDWLREPWFVDAPAFMAKAASLAADYRNAQPFPHAVIDGLFPDGLLDAILREFPGPRDTNWMQYNSTVDCKLESRNEAQLGPVTRLFLHELNSSPFVLFLETLTGISGLIPDPHLFGGGLHQIERGGYLHVHADFNKHPHTRLDRRLNVLLYLNRGWTEGHGGALELWDEKMTACQKSILPVFNRLVVFSTTSTSFHGHPDPLTCPWNESRKSIAMYYYSNGRPALEVREEHSTLWQKRPGEH